jgi:hypothetical protein
MIPHRQGRGIRVSRYASPILLALGFALVLAGCSDDENPVVPCDDCCQVWWTIPDTPQNTSRVLAASYASRDSVGIMALYDSTYTGNSTDLGDPGSEIDLTYADEARHAAALARTAGISAYVDFGPPATWDRLPSDDPSHPEWAMIRIADNGYTIQVSDGTTTLEAKGEAGAYQEFTFTPRLDCSSQTDTLWRIVRWREVGNSTPPGP